MRYVYVKPLGRGSAGETFIARGTSTGREVVVKLFKEGKEGFQKGIVEASILSRIPPHLNIIKFIEQYITDDNRVAVVLEYIPHAITLEEYITHGPIPLSIQLSIMIQLTDAVRHLHTNHILHRDIKPLNVMIKNHVPILIDYDLACVNAQPDEQTGEFYDPLTDELLDHSLRCVGNEGTPLYQDVDFFLKKSVIPKNLELSDIYSLGATFYAIAAGGRTPYEADDEEVFLDKVFAGPDPLDLEDKDLENLIKLMIDRKRSRRPSLNYIYDVLSDMIKSL